MGDEPPQNEVGMCSFCGALASQRCANCKLAFYCRRECQKEDWIKGHKNECKPVKVESNSVLGRHLIATRDFKAGDIIFKENPLIVGPKQITEPLCLSCYKKVDGSYRCSKCNWPLCGPDCEKGQEHLPECVVGQEMGSPIDISDFSETNHFYEVVLPLRCLTLKKSAPKKYAQLLTLESHYEEKKGTDMFKENKNRIVNMLRNYFMLLAFPPEEIDASETMIQRVIGILDTNSIDIPWGAKDICALYLLFSLTEHSCTPNIKTCFNKKKMVITKAAVDIKRGDHLQTMYTHILWGTIARREHLKLNKHFMCTCVRCADPTELGTNFSSIKCQSCRAGYLTSAAPLDELADWICSNCSEVLKLNQIKQLTMTLGEEVEIALANPTIQGLEHLIGKNSSTLVHPNHFHLFAAKHTLLQMYGRQGESSENVMIKKEKLCKEFLKTCTTLDPGMSRLSMYASVALYEYHLAIMSISRQPDGSPPTPQSIKKDVELAKALLRQCITLLDDGLDPQEGSLRSIATNNLRELEELEAGLP